MIAKRVRLAVRIGFHFGPAIEKAGDFFGDAVNVAARMAGLAKGGKIITTGATVDALSPLLRKATRLQVVSPGERMLRGSELGLRCSELLRGVFGNRTGLRQRRAGRGKLGGRRGLGSARRQYDQERERSHIRTHERHISYPELPGLKNGVAENGSRRRNSRDRNLQHATT